MQFVHRKRRQPPAIIIVALIDVLIVVLIFLMVTTSFKHRQPAIKLALPESKQAKAGASEDLPVEITIDRKEPHFYMGGRAVTLERLQNELLAKARENPNLQLAIRADKDAPFGKIVEVMDAAKSANLKPTVNVFTKPAGK